MPNFETKSTRRTGQGPPAESLGFIGDRYTDERTGEVWAKRKTGWTNRAFVEIHPTIRQKTAWVDAANKAGQGLGQWAAENLDVAAEEQTK